MARSRGHWLVMVEVASAFREAAVDSLADQESSSEIETLLDAHMGFIWRVFRRMGLCPADADDATQQVFMIVSTRLDKIAPHRERAYLYGIARRVQSHMRRAQRRRREVPIDDATDPGTSGGATPEEDFALREAWQALDQLLARLPEKLRRVLVLVEVEELQIAEVAQLEGIPIGTAASRLRLGRERFSALLAKHSPRTRFGGES